MAKIFGNYEINGELFLKSYSQQPYPLILSTDSDGKVIFRDSVNSITASFPIVIDSQTDIVSISHATSSQATLINSDRNVIQSITLDSQFGHVIDINSIDLDGFYVRYDVNSQGLDLTKRQNARTNIEAVSRDTDDTRTGKLTQNGDVDLTGNLKVISGDILISSDKKIDTINPGILNIGTANSDIINIGKPGSSVNIEGALLYQNVTNLEVTDKLIRINKGGSNGSGIGSGFEIEEGEIITSYFKTNGSRNGWSLKVPSKSADFNLSFDLLSTTNREQKFQNEDGTIALIGTGLKDDRYIRQILVNDLSPLFTSTTASTTPTETISFTLSNADSNTFFGNNTDTNGSPSYTPLEALTSEDDTNVTLSLGGTPNTALAKAVSLKLGWVGQLEVSRGGTGASTLTGVLIGNGTSAISTSAGTSNQVLRRNSTNTAYEFGLIQNDNITDTTIQYTKIQNVTANRLLGRLSTTNGTIQELEETDIRNFILKGNITQGSAINLSGTLTNRLIGSGDVTINHDTTSNQASVLNTNGNVIQSITLDTNFGHVTALSTTNLDSRFVRYDINSQNLNSTQKQNARTNISSVSTNTSEIITGLKTIQIAGQNNGSAPAEVLNFGIGTDNLYRLTLNNTQNEVSASGEVTWFFTHRFNIGTGTSKDNDLISFFRGTLITGGRNPSSSVSSNIQTYYSNNSTGRYPIHAYHIGNQQYTDGLIIGTENGVVNAVNGDISDLPSGVKLKVYGKGNFNDTLTASNFITTSDIRLKSNIKPIENALDTISKFVSYEYMKNGLSDAGFIAQELKEVLPYTVFENEDGLLTMSDRPILAYLHKAILELKEEIEKIKK